MTPARPRDEVGAADDDVPPAAPDPLLAGALGPDPGALDDVAALGRAAFARRAGESTADLVHDSADEVAGRPGGGPSAVRRSVAAERTLVYRAGPLTVELEVGAGVVRGILVPAGPGRVLAEVATARGPDGVARAEIDDTGWFRLDLPGAGPTRLHCERGTDRLLTDWFLP